MSPRRNRRDAGTRGAPARASRAGDGGGTPGGPERTEEGPDGEWAVRPVSGAGAVKPYRCPGCDQEIPAGVAHLVVWPADVGGPEDRRHWHRPCWQARLRRGPRIQRSRSAPRY